MIKRILIPLFLLMFLLVACNGETQTPVVQASEQEEAPASEATATEITPTEPPAESEGLTASDEFVSECAVGSPSDPPEQYVTLFSPTDDDWVYGPETAAITIVEYGDYQ